MADIRAVSSGKNPYEVGSYTAKSNEKNTLTIESYFKLLSAQLAHQDMSNPMDNSEMMAQMTQMAMVQSLSTMTSNMKEEMALTKTTYLAGLIGKEVTVKLPEKENSLVENQPKEKSGVIASVNLSGKEATFRIEGDTTEYLLSDLIQIGKGNSRSNKRSGCKHGKYREHSGKRGELSCRPGIRSRCCSLSKRTEWKLRKKIRKNGFFLHFFIN